ncbi:hypothetical protein ACQZL8_001079 [Campylobacter jejuni]|uniref:hypothetical protein n=1 Tax=Campylobacter jejuni TaxID=197 RepID=UPI000B170DC0|nr:hypothetical protein [Campylobacter jejuni]EHU8449566.1 hypothetical protein [Campylobacter jejuni]EIM9406101.1 hypothetical protein [Campylobacter jejuni]EIY0145788.1 hypothetical protein [Campylobacter jejuni]EJM4421543.1 hypothetical protein [Campylobacter jejuni]EKG7390697.1 hypothetical protein [Campylobacter jejuni]
MAIDRKDYNIPIGKGTHLKRHKDKITPFYLECKMGVKKSNTLLLFFTPCVE